MIPGKRRKGKTPGRGDGGAQAGGVGAGRGEPLRGAGNGGAALGTGEEAEGGESLCCYGGGGWSDVVPYSVSQASSTLIDTEHPYPALPGIGRLCQYGVMLDQQ